MEHTLHNARKLYVADFGRALEGFKPTDALSETQIPTMTPLKTSKIEVTRKDILAINSFLGREFFWKIILETIFVIEEWSFTYCFEQSCTSENRSLPVFLPPKEHLQDRSLTEKFAR